VLARLKDANRRHAEASYRAAAHRWEALAADQRILTAGRRELEVMALAASVTGHTIAVTVGDDGKTRITREVK
jgi:hypothetical protein